MNWVGNEGGPTAEPRPRQESAHEDRESDPHGLGDSSEFFTPAPRYLHSEPAGIDAHWIPGTPTRHFNIGGRSLSPTSGWDRQTLGYTDHTP